jgi:hypothetical protein
VNWATGNCSESLTTYGADYLYAEQHSAETARDYRRGILQDYLNDVHGDDDLPLRAFHTQNSLAARAIGYGKTAMVFHMLRRLVASWEAIFASFTAITKRDLGTFHAQWID